MPKLYALEAWVDHAVFVNALRAAGTVTKAQRQAVRSAVLGANSIDTLRSAYEKQGFTASLGDLLLDSNVTLVLLYRSWPPASRRAGHAALQSGQVSPSWWASIRSSAHVLVSQRYGTWDQSRLALDSTPGAGLPSFVRYTSAGNSLVPPPIH